MVQGRVLRINMHYPAFFQEAAFFKNFCWTISDHN